MKAKLIEAHALIESVYLSYAANGWDPKEVHMSARDFEENLMAAPEWTLTVEPVKQGEWIDEGRYDDFFPHHAWRCSECGEHVIEIDIPWYKYCPSCGAKMDEVTE